MIIGIDSNVLTLILSLAARVPEDVTRARERLDELYRQLEVGDIKPLVVSTIVVGEVCSHAEGSWKAYSEQLQNPRLFRLVDFDIASSVELQELNKAYYAERDPVQEEPFPPFRRKPDRLIAASYKRYQCTHVVTHDKQLGSACRFSGLEVWDINSLPLPVRPSTRDLFDATENDDAKE